MGGRGFHGAVGLNDIILSAIFLLEAGLTEKWGQKNPLLSRRAKHDADDTFLTVALRRSDPGCRVGAAVDAARQAVAGAKRLSDVLSRPDAERLVWRHWAWSAGDVSLPAGD